MDSKKLLDYANKLINGLNADTKLIYTDQYNLFAGLPKTSVPMNNWQEYLYHKYGINKCTSNRILQSYYDRGFYTERRARSDKSHIIMNCPQK